MDQSTSIAVPSSSGWSKAWTVETRSGVVPVPAVFRRVRHLYEGDVNKVGVEPVIVRYDAHIVGLTVLECDAINACDDG